MPAKKKAAAKKTVSKAVPKRKTASKAASKRKTASKAASKRKTASKAAPKKKTASKAAPKKKTASKAAPKKKTTSKAAPKKKTTSKAAPKKKTTSKAAPKKKTTSKAAPATKTTSKAALAKKTASTAVSRKKTATKRVLNDNKAGKAHQKQHTGGDAVAKQGTPVEIAQRQEDAGIIVAQSKDAHRDTLTNGSDDVRASVSEEKLELEKEVAEAQEKAGDVQTEPVKAPAVQTPRGWNPNIVVFACNWCSYAGADTAGVSRIQHQPHFRTIRVMCSGRVHPGFVMRAFEKGADGVLVSGCHFGDCHYVSGNERAVEQYEITTDLLRLLGIEEGRIRLEWISAAEGGRFAQVINEFTDEVRALGPSPVARSARAG